MERGTKVMREGGHKIFSNSSFLNKLSNCMFYLFSCCMSDGNKFTKGCNFEKVKEGLGDEGGEVFGRVGTDVERGEDIEKISDSNSRETKDRKEKDKRRVSRKEIDTNRLKKEGHFDRRARTTRIKGEEESNCGVGCTKGDDTFVCISAF